MFRIIKSLPVMGRTLGVLCVLAITPVHGANTMHIGGSGTDLATFGLLADAYMQAHPGSDVRVLPSLGSGGGMRALAAGKVAIALTSRPLKEKEKSPKIRAFHYARTPMVFAVSANNPVSSATAKELAAIYAGEQRTWSSGQAVRPILRPASDSDTQLLRKTYTFFKGALETAARRAGIPTATSDQDSADMLERVPHAVGTSTLALILAENRRLKALTLDGVGANAESVAQGRYPMVKELYLAVAKAPDDDVRAFLQFLASAQGRDILQRTGHAIIPLDLTGL